MAAVSTTRRAWLGRLAALATAPLAGGCTSLPWRFSATGFTPLMLVASAPQAAPVVLYGTLHVGTPRMQPLPEAVQAGWDATSALAVEIDAPVRWNALVADFRPRVPMPAGTTVDDVLPAALVAEVRDYFGFDDAQWQTLRRRQPWWIANFRFTTPADRELAAGLERGGERHFLSLARETARPILELERPEEQVLGVSGGSMAEQAAQFERWYRAVRAHGGMLGPLLAAWRHGDVARLSAYKAAAWGDAATLPTLRERFFTARDRRMAERIAGEARALPGRPLFVAVGAYHLVDDDGIPARLAADGFTVRRIDHRDPVPALQSAFPGAPGATIPPTRPPA